MRERCPDCFFDVCKLRGTTWCGHKNCPPEPRTMNVFFHASIDPQHGTTTRVRRADGSADESRRRRGCHRRRGRRLGCKVNNCAGTSRGDEVAATPRARRAGRRPAAGWICRVDAASDIPRGAARVATTTSRRRDRGESFRRRLRGLSASRFAASPRPSLEEVRVYPLARYSFDGGELEVEKACFPLSLDPTRPKTPYCEGNKEARFMADTKDELETAPGRRRKSLVSARRRPFRSCSVGLPRPRSYALEVSTNGRASQVLGISSRDRARHAWGDPPSVADADDVVAAYLSRE